MCSLGKSLSFTEQESSSSSSMEVLWNTCSEYLTTWPDGENIVMEIRSKVLTILAIISEICALIWLPHVWDHLYDFQVFTFALWIPLLAVPYITAVIPTSLFESLIVFAKPIKFAVLFTFGNMLAVGSTAFIIGPGQQMRMMLDPVRIYATAIYVGCVVLALICALVIRSKVLTILAIISEICALIWYSLSYIPFARRLVSDMMIRLFDTEI
ncbi:hypothetical protein TEA_023888 [Camellia sinensis var. sinensis]|uniref:Vesicle transport protein n=1 Tax=Camellia sinensis var. sinensis TaxID=542762 RepID=A0A4S4DFQ2_CAMSN|nr:hypothetical protein TEA_023888 [Camellia sinensis var. sinensis]